MVKKSKSETVITDNALLTVLAQLRKKFGSKSIGTISQTCKELSGIIPTPVIGINKALVIEGFPQGRIVEIYGPEGAAKTTLVLETLREAISLIPNKQTAFIDMEHALDPNYPKLLGIPEENMFYSTPPTAEDAMDILMSLARSGAFSAIALDSVASLTPAAEMEGNAGDQTVGAQARLLSKELRKLAFVARETDTLLIFLNQQRMNVNTMGYGSPVTTPGGKALKYYASIRMELKVVQTLKKGEDDIGKRIKVTVHKNKLAPQGKKAYFDLIYGEGIDSCGEILDLGIKESILTLTGRSYFYNNVSIGGSRDAARRSLHDSLELKNEIKDKILVSINPIVNMETGEIINGESDSESSGDAEELIV